MLAINLKTEHLVNPIGIDVETPLLSWNCEDLIEQTAFELEAKSKIAGEKEQSFIQTGKIVSSQMFYRMEKKASSRQKISWRIRVWNEKNQASDWSSWASYEMGLLRAEDFTADWVNPELTSDAEAHKPASYLRKKFVVEHLKQEETVSRLYISAHGLYEAWINGVRVGNYVLMPGSNNYEKHIAYQTYEVSGYLREGENEIQVVLGDGWYRSVSGVDGDRNLYGTDVALYAQLEVNGKVVCSSDKTWEACQDGPIRENDMQQGEVVDMRFTCKDWHGVEALHYGTDKFFATNCQGITEHERFVGKLLCTPDGRKVFDFGQNMAGYVEFTVLDAKEGQKIILTHGETLDENGNFTQENFQDRKRHKEGGTKQQVVFTCKEGENHYKTKFSIWGFRYALLEGEVVPENIQIEAIAVYTDMEERAGFTCSNEKVNRLFQNCMWSMKGNFCDVPTDCPTRERAAWTGDMGVFIDTGMYLMDCYPVVRKWLEECRLAQYPDGKVANIAPRNNNPSFFSGLLAGSVGWGDAVILVPYAMYKHTGDIQILVENYDMMKKWYGFLTNRAKQKPLNPVKRLKRNPYRRYTIETGIDYGEWCEPDVESTNAMRTPQGKVATAYFAFSGILLSEIAKLLGEDVDSIEFHKTAINARKAFRHIAVVDGKIQTDRQAELIRAISFDLLTEEEKEKAAADLNNLVEKNGFHLNTGFLSTPALCSVLTEYGYEETAYKVFLQETAPSWLYAVNKGATSIWEAWNGVDEEGVPHESLNHYSKGAIASWMLRDICGIRVDKTRSYEENVIEIAPHPNKSIPSASAWVTTELGRVEVKYDMDDNQQFHYQIVVPSNVKISLLLPGKERQILQAGVYHLQ